MAASEPDSKLKRYRAKRAHERTPEPFGGTPISGVQRFVVQHHAARRTHYDFRLEWQGVLKSWAVPKGPSPNPADKRLAVRTEDHPLDYADFEGRIPEGNYGAGAVIVWDRGLWLPLADFDQGFDTGKLLFELRGHKLRGKWTLVKTKRSPNDWLLIKERDPHVDDRGTSGYAADSVFSGLTVEELKQQVNKQARLEKKSRLAGAEQKPVPAKSLKPMLAQTSDPFSSTGWIFEIKYDGYRLIVEKRDDRVTLFSRNHNDLSASFPEIVHAVAALPYRNFIIDGEAVVHDQQGLPSFSMLQKRGRLTRAPDIKRAALSLPATLYAFDLIAFGAYDLRPLPVAARKSTLSELLPTHGAIRFSDHIEEQGELMFRQVGEMGLEGIVAKQSGTPYVGGRSGYWLKIPVAHSDDFVIVGYTDARGTRSGFGALLLAQYIDDTLMYTGRVGSGFNTELLRRLSSVLDRALPDEPPQRAPTDNRFHWIHPELVCTVKYKQITPDGLLRAPVFVSLRDDKDPGQCRRDYYQRQLPETAAEPGHPEKIVSFTNLDKTFWPEQSYTKGDLIEYYRAISDWILPYLKDRPLVLTRYPDGIDGKSFYQKDAPDFVPEWIRTINVWSEQTQREISYFVIEDTESLSYIANMGTIPLHMWLSRTQTLQQPDWCVLDLDPKSAPFKDVVSIARAIHHLCADIGLANYVKTSGSTGLHVLIPLGATYTYEQCRNLGEVLARIVVREQPDISTVTRAPAKRDNKVYIDYLQNRHGQTIAAPFSVRPLPGAPVSMPLRWDEVKPRNDNGKYTIKNALRRLRAIDTDPMLPVLTGDVDLEVILDRLKQQLQG